MNHDGNWHCKTVLAWLLGYQKPGEGELERIVFSVRIEKGTH